MKLLIFFVFFALSLLYADENLFKPIPQSKNVLSPKAQLGKQLFHDPILSKNNTVSCSTCHPIANYGVDNLKTSVGIKGGIGNRNTPTVFNAVYNVSQFWDGRAKNLKEQALFPIINPVEMGSTLESVVQKLKNNPSYAQQFHKIYPDGVNALNLADALASYETTLTTPGSKFDAYLRGNKNALNKREKAGLELFKNKGCVACHNGINIGGALYQKIGLFDTFKSDMKPDLGRYTITKKSFDKYYFKVPSLRNVEKTAPYFHDGSVSTLKEAVKTMTKLQLGRDLEENEIDDIVLFLKTLTGKIRE